MKHRRFPLKPGIAILVLLLIGLACRNYYKVIQVPSSSVDTLHNASRYLILRNATIAYHMKDAKLSEDRSTLTCTLDTVGADHQLYLMSKEKGGYYRKNIESGPAANGPQVLEEVHFYIPYDRKVIPGSYTLDLANVYKLEVVEHDTRRTNAHAVGGSFIAIGSIAFIVGMIVILTKASCPFVSAYTGEEFELQGEIYGGAIYPQLARDDYMPLRMKPTENGTLMLKISNELKERQYTDLADLTVITHQKNSKVLADVNGTLYSISRPALPQTAWTTNIPDATPLLNVPDDGLSVPFNDTMVDIDENFLIAKFKNPSHSPKAILVLSAKNTNWVDNLYQELAKQFGDYYPVYVKQQEKKPAAELKKWAQQQRLPLMVSVKTNTGWKNAGIIPTIGPLANRQLVVPLDLSDVFSEDVEIKLSTGFMFWEIDYLAIDFSNDKDFSVQTLSPSKATDERGMNVLAQLKMSDGSYLEQPAVGNVATLEYKCDRQPEHLSRSYILHTKGYYTHLWDFKGKPNYAFLKQLKKPDALSNYSLEMYKKYISGNLYALTGN